MLFYIMIIIIILIIIFIPNSKGKTQENYKVFDMKRDVLSKTNDLAKYLILDHF